MGKENGKQKLKGEQEGEEEGEEGRKEVTVVEDRERVWAKEQLGSDSGF